MALQTLWSLSLTVGQTAECLDGDQVIASVTLISERREGSVTRSSYRVNNDSDLELCVHRNAVKWRLQKVVPGAQPNEDFPAKRRWRVKS